jgi:hypothetical protein
MKRLMIETGVSRGNWWRTLSWVLLVPMLWLGFIGCGGTHAPEALPSTPLETTVPVTIIHPTPTATAPASHPTPATAAASLTISPAGVRVGDTLDVRLELSGVEDLYGVEAQLFFDSSLVAAVDADPEKAGTQSEHGSFLRPDFIIRNAISETEGVIHYAVAQMPPTNPVSGSGVLMRTRLEAASAGELSIVIDSLMLVNASEQEIPVNFEAHEVKLLIE